MREEEQANSASRFRLERSWQILAERERLGAAGVAGTEHGGKICKLVLALVWCFSSKVARDCEQLAGSKHR